VHPRPADPSRAAFYAWLLGRPWDAEMLPAPLQSLEIWKENRVVGIPDVPFRLLTALGLEPEHWAAIARRASWQETRMNLNAFARHGVFENPGLVRQLARRLADPKLVRRARAFPYQLLIAYLNAGDAVPTVLCEALQDAMETALTNVPRIKGRVVVCPDVSGSMHCPVTGWQKGACSQVRCVDAAALVAAALLRRNRDAVVLPFADDVVPLQLNPRDTVMTNAAKLGSLPPAGTRCSAPLRRLNETKTRADLVVFVSDNESWIDARRGATETLRQWERFRSRNPKARLACIDLVPNTTTQAPGREDILNIGGFSDAVFDLLAAFAAGADGASHWISEIEKQPLPMQ
jgi:60 kDa SS-A/Ro ribonucleoprotein